jgi:hypothetical protein
MAVEPSMSVLVQAETPPLGFVAVNALPLLSVATHRVAVGQLTDVIDVVPSM